MDRNSRSAKLKTARSTTSAPHQLRLDRNSRSAKLVGPSYKRPRTSCGWTAIPDQLNCRTLNISDDQPLRLDRNSRSAKLPTAEQVAELASCGWTAIPDQLNCNQEQPLDKSGGCSIMSDEKKGGGCHRNARRRQNKTNCSGFFLIAPRSRPRKLMIVSYCLSVN